LEDRQHLTAILGAKYTPADAAEVKRLAEKFNITPSELLRAFTHGGVFVLKQLEAGPDTKEAA
jgi:hypothetical protein